MVDDGKIAFNPAVELSYLEPAEQKTLLDAMTMNDCTPSHAQAIRLKKMAQEGVLGEQDIYDMMSEEKPNQREIFRLPMEQIRKYVPNANPKQAEDFVLKACEHYRKFLIRQKNRDER